MANHCAGSHSVRLHRGGQGNLNGEYRRLHPIDTYRGLVGQHRLGDRESGLMGDQRLDFGDGRCEDRLGSQQGRTHPGPLRTLAGEHPYRPIDVVADGRNIRSGAVRHCAQLIDKLEVATCQHDCPYRAVRTSLHEGVREIGNIHRIRALGDPVGHPSGGLTQRLGRGRRQCEDHRLFEGIHWSTDRAACRFGCLTYRGLLQDDVHIGPGQSVGRHRRTSGVLRVLRPFGGGLRHEKTGLDAFKFGSQSREVQILRHDAVFKRQDCLHHADGPGSGLGVAEICLHRPEHAASVCAVDLRQTVEFEGIADRSPGAVRFDIAHGAAIQSGGLKRGPVDVNLSVRRRGRDVDRVAVLIGGGATNQGKYPIPVANRIVEPLEQKHHRGLTEHEPVSRGIECPASTGWRQHSLSRARGHLARLEGDGHAPGQSEVTLTVLEAAARQVDRKKARRARRINGVGRALQPQPVGDPARRQTEVASGEPVRALDDPGVSGYQLVVAVSHPDKDAGRRFRQGYGVDACVFDRLPRGLQQQAMLRVNRLGLALADTEKLRIKAGYIVEERAPLRHRIARNTGFGVVHFLRVPPVKRDLSDEVVAAQQRVPKLIRGGDAAGEPAAHTNHRYWVQG